MSKPTALRFHADAGDEILLTAIGISADMVSVSVMSEAEFKRFSDHSLRFTDQESQQVTAVVTLTKAKPTATWKAPANGEWFAVYDQDSATRLEAKP